MSGINHITGGTIFTGIFASFWNVNIFSKLEYLGLCTLFSVLPDIDHVKSPIGKLFYPLAKYLDNNFGHSTITHSLLAFLPLVLFSFLIEKTFSIILIFSYKGIPLFYPFNKNPCVIPGNPSIRLKSGYFKTECIIFCLLISIGIGCKSMFENGFWTTLNRTFETIRHVHYEFISAPTLLKLDYEFHYLGKSYQGNGYVVCSTPNKLIVFDHGF